MTDDEVERVADYIDTFAYIRKCCGLQSSKWERKRLHQCPITQEDMESPDYPHCEAKDKHEMELKLESLGIKTDGDENEGDINWSKVGDCKRFDDMIIGGLDFNGREFKGCDKMSF
eukprot:CAMPEP_0204650390 /NCGR_PEP_ID=MMETSP0718-20130828/11471_1 /ASSEMBLY_ACC=CAM_ASM_000674 /TAXON_ID=230516 /ORGANISM="Chaetoceros curvisetus" /LENGTH=115 /DNA_ID=CAMNT_0051673791 /DNA_START=69 /DNA_END=416 /DNA_ORIENTATION=+